MSTFHVKIIRGLLAGLAVAVFTGPGFAVSPRDLIAQGNQAYRNGHYNEAMTAYEKASVDAPESPYIYFNKGAVYYQKGDYEKARDAFEKAALKAGDLSLEARSKYNLGNCFFEEGERQKGGDIKKALAAYETSIKYYQAALKLDPGFRDAAHNIEVARLVLKDILDKIKKQQEEAEKQQKKQNEMAEKLKQLIDQQQKNIERNEKLASEKPQTRPANGMKKRAEDLADRQRKTKEETKKLSEQMAQSPAQTQPADSPAKKAREHLDRSVKDQATAEQRLRNERTKEAQAPQKQALDELKKALSDLSSPQKNQSKPGQAKQDKQENSSQNQPSSQPQPKENPDRQKAGVPRDETARDILNEEKENREQNRQATPGGSEPVDKDW